MIDSSYEYIPYLGYWNDNPTEVSLRGSSELYEWVFGMDAMEKISHR